MDCRVKPGNDDHLHRELLLRAGPRCRRIRSSKFFGCMRLMKGLRHSVRAAIVAALALTSIAGTTVAEEVTYLMYLKGSEGPPATPFRVLWDVLDQANAHIIIDLGAKYEPALTKLGLDRVLKYDAKREQSRFVVRNPDLTHFVKIVGTSIVKGILETSPIAGAWAQKPDAEVRMAEFHITPEPHPARLEITTWLHVNYLAPQKAGSPKPQDLIKGDLIFVGQPEPKQPDGPEPPSKP